MDKKVEQKGFKITDINQCGCYVVFLSLVYLNMALTQLMNILFMSFADRRPTVEDNCNYLFPNLTSNCTGSDTCYVLRNETKIQCSTKHYDFIPVTYDFDVAGDKVKVGTMFQNIGMMIGAILFGILSDLYGRKTILLLCTVFQMLALFATSYASTFILFVVLRFFCMLFTGGQNVVSNPFFMENLPDKHRMWVATIITYSPCYLMVSGIAYMCQYWRRFAKVAGILTGCTIFLLPLLEETPNWLVMKNKKERAVKAALKIQKWNRRISREEQAELEKAVKEFCDAEAEKRKSGKRTYYFWHLFKDCKLASYACFFAFSLFSTSVISLGIAYNLDKIAGNVYINVLILGGARYTINICAALIDFTLKAGRRALHLLSTGFIVIALGSIFVIKLFIWRKTDKTGKAGHSDDSFTVFVENLIRYTALIVAAMCTEVFILDAVQPAELFPTPVRNAGIAFIQFINRIGTSVSPLLFIPSKHWPPFPFLVMFFTSSMDFLLYALLIPETRGKKMVNRMPWESQTTDETVGSPTSVTGSAGRSWSDKNDILKESSSENYIIV